MLQLSASAQFVWINHQLALLSCSAVVEHAMTVCLSDIIMQCVVTRHEQCRPVTSLLVMGLIFLPFWAFFSV